MSTSASASASATTSPFAGAPLSEVIRERRRARKRANKMALEARKANEVRELLERARLGYAQSVEFAPFAELPREENLRLLRLSEAILLERPAPLVWAFHNGLTGILREMLHYQKQLDDVRVDLVMLLAEEARHHEVYLALSAEIRRRG